MTLDKRTRAQMLSCCEEIHDDDGIDPREFFREGRREKKEDHRTRRLCQQVAETLHQVLPGSTGDSSLDDLRVENVQPAPNAARLRVTLRWIGTVAEFDRKQIEHTVATAAGRLRFEVAAAITRRKAPILTFQILGPEIAPQGGAQ